jgi:hypothetical protein
VDDLDMVLKLLSENEPCKIGTGLFDSDNPRIALNERILAQIPEDFGTEDATISFPRAVGTDLTNVALSRLFRPRRFCPSSNPALEFTVRSIFVFKSAGDTEEAFAPVLRNKLNQTAAFIADFAHLPSGSFIGIKEFLSVMLIRQCEKPTATETMNPSTVSRTVLVPAFGTIALAQSEKSSFVSE